jgi:NAD(P)-dependent dehydrogenase (short-subunit alcohol dehydrogenase family)
MSKVAFITGGTRGIGLGIAKSMAQKGFDLALNGMRDKDSVLTILEELEKSGIQVDYFQGNIGSAEDRSRILEEILEKFGKINILVNNAGVAPKVRADILDVVEEDFDYVVDTNMKGTFFLSQAVAKSMIKSKEKCPEDFFTIITITSVSAVLASTNRVAYCMSKSGLSMMNQTFAVRLAEYEIPVFEIRPGIIETDMTAVVKEKYETQIANGLTLEPRMGKPEDIGKTVSALAEGTLTYGTGQIITLDGGMTVGRL